MSKFASLATPLGNGNGGDMIAAIESALARLRGLPLWSAGRAADMLWLALGARHKAPTKRSPDREVGDFALHVLCPWRISGSGGVITGRGDIYVPADPDEDEADFRWDRPGRSIVDAQLRHWIDAHAAAPLRVTDIVVDRCAGFTLHLDQNVAIEVFPDAFAMPHDLREQWRLLSPGRDDPHFVVNNHGWS